MVTRPDQDLADALALIAKACPELVDRAIEIDPLGMVWAGVDLAAEKQGIYPADLGAEGDIIIDGTATEINDVQEKEIRALRDMRERD